MTFWCSWLHRPKAHSNTCPPHTYIPANKYQNSPGKHFNLSANQRHSGFEAISCVSRGFSRCRGPDNRSITSQSDASDSVIVPVPLYFRTSLSFSYAKTISPTNHAQLQLDLRMILFSRISSAQRERQDPRSFPAWSIVKGRKHRSYTRAVQRNP